MPWVSKHATERVIDYPRRVYHSRFDCFTRGESVEVDMEWLRKRNFRLCIACGGDLSDVTPARKRKRNPYDGEPWYMEGAFD